MESIKSSKKKDVCRYKITTKKIVSFTSDGASVNTGKNEGLMTRMKRGRRDWLVPIHCVNHGVEFAIKDSFDESPFSAFDKLYITLFNLFKNSATIKSEVHQAAEVLEISVYTLPTLMGTWFVSHRRQAFTCLLDMWPAIVIALENTLTVHKHKPDTRAKISGLVTQLRSYKFICLTCCYLDILEKITPVLMLFEENSLLPRECSSVIR